MMRCPRCGSRDYKRYKSPKSFYDSIVRRHTCQGCGLLFMSIQTPVTGITAEMLAGKLDL